VRARARRAVNSPATGFHLADLGDEVWVARRRDIARFWREHYPR